MNSHSVVKGFDNLIYDGDYTEYKRKQSLGPLHYHLDSTQTENKHKCVHKKFYTRQDPDIVDAESELKNLTRIASKYPGNYYNPNCKPSKTCTSTYDLPINPDPVICPIIHSNLHKYYNK